MRLLALLLGLAGGSLQAFSLQPLIHLDLRGGYAGVAGQSSTSLIQGEFLAVPAMQLADDLSLTPSLYMVGGGQQRSLEEGALFVETASLGFRPQLKFQTESGSAYLLRLEGRRAYNVEAVNEATGGGRYDYEDLRAAAGWESAPGDWPYGASAEISHRGYPNYHNIAAAVALTDDKNYYLKDYYGSKGEAHVGLPPLGRLSASAEWKAYTDAYVISPVNGLVNTSQAQHDLLYEVALQGSSRLAERFALGWNLGWQGSASNQNTFDTVQAVGQPNGDDYAATVAGLSAQWKQGPDGLGVMGAYSANFRNFNRPLQDPSGAYAKGFVAEVEHDFDLAFSLPLGHSLTAVAAGSARILLSNQGYAAAGIPNYDYFSSNIGLQWEWQGAR